MGFTPLFTDADISGLLGRPVRSDKVTTAERVVWGWLKKPLGLDERPASVSDELFSWAVELGAIAYENPTSLDSYQLGAERFGSSAARRAQILESAAESSQAGGSGTDPGGPQGSFPPACPAPTWC